MRRFPSVRRLLPRGSTRSQEKLILNRKILQNPCQKVLNLLDLSGFQASKEDNYLVQYQSDKQFALFFFNVLLGFCEAKMSLAEICENAKMAREYALLGNYDTSLVYYQGVIQQIQKHIQQLKDDAIMKQEWHQVGSFSHCNSKINSQRDTFLELIFNHIEFPVKTE